MANNIQESLDQLINLDGAMAAALVDSDSGMALGTAGGGLNLDVAAAGNTEVVRSKSKVMSSLGIKDKIEDILISLGTQYHLIRPLSTHKNLFFYVVLNRSKSNLAMSKIKLSEIENLVQV
jgi:predicted regulator of Ras-like GTPase activity (Roadblock/LC7/MglB family)